MHLLINTRDDFYYHLTGTYDRNGVITGDVDFGKFMNADKTMPETIAGERVGGTLTRAYRLKRRAWRVS